MNACRVQDSPELNRVGCSLAELEECRALRAFYRAFRGKRWHRKDGWSTPHRDAPQVSLDDFEGVTVRQGGLVDEIRLAGNGLRSPRTRERDWRTLRSLRYLRVLDLSKNSLYGRIPQALFEVPTFEEIDLHGNKFVGTIPAEFGRLHQLKRLRLNDNMLSGPIPEEVKNMPTLELLDCSNNDLRDLLPAWACMGTVFAQVGDPYPTHMYLFVMGIPPKSLVGGWSAYAREAQAKTQASELIQWHLEKLRRESACNSMGASQTGVDVEGGRSSTIERLEAGAAAPAVAGIGSARALSSDRAFGEMGVSAPSMEISGPSVSTLIAETQVQLVTLPHHWRATVQFDVKVNGLSCRTIPFGTASDDDDDGGIPGSVFGGVPNDFGTQKDISFPHRVVGISGGDVDATDTECRNDPSSPVLHHRGPFTLKNDELFADSWEARAHQNDRCNNRCYNGLHRYGFKRARNILFFVALLMLAVQLIGLLSGGSTVGSVFSGLLAMALFIVLRMEMFFFPRRFAPSTRSSRWVNMPVLSFTVEPAREEAAVDSA